MKKLKRFFSEAPKDPRWHIAAIIISSVALTVSVINLLLQMVQNP